MKKIIICLLFSLFLLSGAAFSNDNFIYSINVSRDNISEKNINLDVKSDYKTKIVNKVDENGREYFDIKDASLKENFAVQYNDAKGVESVIAQQIGNKVRIYVKGSDIEDVLINFNNVENQPYPDKSAGYALCIFSLVMFSILSLFKKKTKKLNTKTKTIQNTVSKSVYDNLMGNRTGSSMVFGGENLTLDNIHKRKEGISKQNVYSSRMNIKTIEEHRKRQSLANAKIAM